MALFGLWMMIIGGGVALTLFGVTVRGRHLFFYGGGLGPAAAVVGAVIGLLSARAEARKSDTSPTPHSGAEATIKAAVERGEIEIID